MIFEGYEFVVDIHQRDGRLSQLVVEELIARHGGRCSSFISRSTSFVVVDTPTSFRCAIAREKCVPVVSGEFVSSCIDQEQVLDPQIFLVANDSIVDVSGEILRNALSEKELELVTIHGGADKGAREIPSVNDIEGYFEFKPEAGLPRENSFKTADSGVHFRGWMEGNYTVLRAEFFRSTVFSISEQFHIVELHSGSVLERETGRKLDVYRVFRETGPVEDPTERHSFVKHLSHLETAIEAFILVCKAILSDYVMAYERKRDIPTNVGSRLLQLSPAVTPTVIHSDVHQLVLDVYSASERELGRDLEKDVNSISQEQIERAIGILFRLNDPKEEVALIKNLVTEFHKCIPMTRSKKFNFYGNNDFERAMYLIDMIRDVKIVSECTQGRGDADAQHSIALRYKALNTVLVPLVRGSAEYEQVKNHISSSQGISRRRVVPNLIFKASRYQDEVRYSRLDTVNEKLLFHGSTCANFLGITLRGLRMPKEFITQFGGRRPTTAMLGQGIYFSTDPGKAAAYASKDGRRKLMGIYRVNLGTSFDSKKILGAIEKPPSGYNTIHGVAQTESTISDFMEEEYVIFDESRHKLEYIVSFDEIEGEGDDASAGYLKDVKDMMQKMESEVLTGGILSAPQSFVSEEPTGGASDEIVETFQLGAENYGDEGLGLVAKGDGKVTLQSVHSRALLVDTIGRVILLQEYRSANAGYFEGKYVFPLDSRSAVCGFEAFIGAKHVVGEVKKKEEAHRIYKEAIERGDGAYLMDEEKDKPSIFTVSLGNIPPNVQIVIKIVYITELVQGRLLDLQQVGSEASNSIDKVRVVSLEIPSLSKLGKKQTKFTGEEVTQLTTGSGKVEKSGVLFTFVAGAIMSSGIVRVDSDTHKLLKKVEQNRATIDIGDEYDDTEDLRLFVHVKQPRGVRSSLWVENIEPEGAIAQDDEKTEGDGVAVMLSVLPDLGSNSIGGDREVIFLLDDSGSMKGNENALKDMKRVVISAINLLGSEIRYNVVAFGSHYEYLFLESVVGGDMAARKTAEQFVKRLSGNRGSTELFLTIHALSQSRQGLLDLVLITDGEISSEEMSKVYSYVSEGGLRQTTRIFAFGVGANQDHISLHRITALARGRAVFIEHGKNEAAKIEAQLRLMNHPSARSVTIRWFQDEKCQEELDEESGIEMSPARVLSVFHEDVMRCYAMLPRKGGNKVRAAVVEISDPGCTPFKETIVVSEQTTLHGTTLIHSLAANAIIRNWVDGLIDVDPIKHHIKRMKRKDRIIELSIRYSLVTQFTSFIAVEKRQLGEKIEDVDNLARILGAINVDMTGGVLLESLPFEERWSEAADKALKLEISETIRPLQITKYVYEDYGGEPENEFRTSIVKEPRDNTELYLKYGIPPDVTLCIGGSAPDPLKTKTADFGRFVAKPVASSSSSHGIGNIFSAGRTLLGLKSFKKKKMYSRRAEMSMDNEENVFPESGIMDLKDGKEDLNDIDALMSAVAIDTWGGEDVLLGDVDGDEMDIEGMLEKETEEEMDVELSLRRIDGSPKKKYGMDSKDKKKKKMKKKKESKSDSKPKAPIARRSRSRVPSQKMEFADNSGVYFEEEYVPELYEDEREFSSPVEERYLSEAYEYPKKMYAPGISINGPWGMVILCYFCLSELSNIFCSRNKYCYAFYSFIFSSFYLFVLLFLILILFILCILLVIFLIT